MHTNCIYYEFLIQNRFQIQTIIGRLMGIGLLKKRVSDSQMKEHTTISIYIIIGNLV